MRFRPPLAKDAQSAFLRGLVDRVAAAKHEARSPVVVFDLDGTLLDNRPRTAAILREVATQWERSRPEESRRLAAIQPNEIAYRMIDSLTPLGITEDTAVNEALEHWKIRFFSDELLHHDIPLDGAVSFVHQVYDAGATVVYLTGRDLPNMSLGSWRSLRNYGFPIGVVRSQLICKPAAEIRDEEFKREQAPLLAQIGEIIASFDNEPGNCNLFLQVYPAAASVLLDTSHSWQAPSPEWQVTIVRNFLY